MTIQAFIYHPLLHSFILSAFMGGLIGYVTNWLAIKALFHPQKPWKLLFFEFQGLLPKRQKELANNLGKIVEGELISVEELIKKVEPADVEPIVEDMMRNIRNDLEQQIKDYIASFANKIPFFNFKADGFVKSVMDKLEKELCSVLKRQVPQMLDSAAEKASEKISVQEIVIEKVCNMDLIKLESLFNRIADREMAMIIWLGGVLGVIVGIGQWAIQTFVIA
ncbi:MAG TPA: DUF445 family protein [Candidatus Rifleibacterium sp.]|nr:DUF445 family protein [Candidatus Rifleibacterium sp.]HPT48173.1 DUF445 family protein [Candidatus Rifleibacterium sp.]